MVGVSAVNEKSVGQSTVGWTIDSPTKDVRPSILLVQEILPISYTVI